jgi:predicted PurR-regulated permease PerM
MQTISINNSRLFGLAAFLVSLSIILALLILAKSFLIPFAWSLVIGLASFRMLNRMEKKFKINRFISSLVFIGLILLGIAVLFYFFYREIVSIVNGIPSFSTNLIESIQNLLASLERYGIQAPLIDQMQIHNWVSEHSDTISRALASFGKNIGNIVLIGVYLFFILYYRDNYLYFLKLKNKSDKAYLEAKEKAKEVAGVISSFLYGLFAVTLILSVMLYVIFLIIGLKFALFFAVLVALLALIPYIGNPIGMAIVFLYALVSSDGLMLPLLSLAGIIITNTLKSYIFKPIIIGDKINLNAFAIFLSVITGGLIWGVSGMILFMPFAGIARVLLDYNESTRPFTALFATLPKGILKKPVSLKKDEGQG